MAKETLDAFGAFFEAIYGYKPFPWQSRLAGRVVRGEGWPEVIALPTGAGKSAVIDIAVFAMAAMSDRGTSRAPRRIFFVIDRRVVVDGAYRRAAHLARLLREALEDGQGIVHDVASRLLALGGDVPLKTAILRGGIYLDHDWARDPAQPLVCVSTVDQVGSRLLWRGYGISADKPNNMLPVQAALIGNDALIFLDEAHLSTPFADTLRWIGRYRSWAERPLETPWQVVFMSATPPAGSTQVYREAEDDQVHPDLGKRLTASKRARLVEVQVEPQAPGQTRRVQRALEDQSRHLFAERLCAEAVALLERGPARVIGVVVNRVGTARVVFERLRKLRPSVDAMLLTGRVRPLDRDRLLERWLPRMEAGRQRSPDDPPLFVVATQAIEVGADLDFDALVTECAALDAVRQRFGRLDRYGHLQQTDAVIAVRSDHAARGYDDPVYGEALARTWAWLQQVAGKAKGKGRSGASRDHVVDMGISALSPLLPEDSELDELCSPKQPGPVMLPGHVDLWVQTSPIPQPDPDVALFLHGPGAEPADVQVVWRSDLDAEDPDSWADVVALLPPLSLEAMPVPLVAVRRWLAEQPFEEIADVEGARLTPGTGEVRGRRFALRWAGPAHDGTRIVGADEVRPGDTLVVPASFGGADEYGWNPSSTAPVADLSTLAYLTGRRRHVLRLHPRVLSELVEPDAADLLEALRTRLRALTTMMTAGDPGALELEDQLLEELSSREAVRPQTRQAAVSLLAQPRRRRLAYLDGKGIGGVILAGRADVAGSVPDADGRLTDEDDASTFTRPGRRVSLSEHQRGVEQMATWHAQRCWLPEHLQRDVALAARLHDLGKLDPRFQILLNGGDEVAAAAAAEPMAKSELDPQDRAARRRAWELARLPSGYRHEATSLAVVQSSRRVIEDASDPDLVLHLIASHHGCGRPFMPFVRDEAASDQRIRWGSADVIPPADGLGRLDSGVAERFWRLVRRYGWYGLAYLEAILRLADHRWSEVERGPEND